MIPLVWIGRRVHWSDVARRAAAVGAASIAASFAALLLCIVLCAVRWRVLLRAYGAARLPSVTEALRHMFVGLYFNVMPGGVAGDAVRGYRVREHIGDLTTSYMILLVDRLAGLVGLLAIAVLAAVLGPPLAVRSVNGAMIAASVLGFAVTLLAIGLPFLTARSARARTLVGSVPIVGHRFAALRPPERLDDLLLALALSVGTQACTVLSILILLARLAPAADVLAEARVAPLVVLLVFIPVTPGALGQREALFTEFFGLVGVPAASAVAASMLSFAVVIGLSAIGGITVACEKLLSRRGASPGGVRPAGRFSRWRRRRRQRWSRTWRPSRRLGRRGQGLRRPLRAV